MLKLSDTTQMKTNYVLASMHFCQVFNLIYCTEMLLRPKASPLPGHEYSNEMFNLCWRDYWKATEASRILPKALLKSCYAPAWMTCWDTKTKIKVGYPPRSLRGGRKKKTWSQPVGILSRRQNPICLLSKSFWILLSTTELYATA